MLKFGARILNQVAEPQLFTSMWNKYHQWLSDIGLYQTRSFFSFFFQDKPLFHCWKANRGLKWSRYSWSPINDPFHIYSLGVCHEGLEQIPEVRTFSNVCLVPACPKPCTKSGDQFRVGCWAISIIHHKLRFYDQMAIWKPKWPQRA
jgi:hypothetical protein